MSAYLLFLIAVIWLLDRLDQLSRSPNRRRGPSIARLDRQRVRQKPGHIQPAASHHRAPERGARLREGPRRTCREHPRRRRRRRRAARLEHRVAADGRRRFDDVQRDASGRTRGHALGRDGDESGDRKIERQALGDTALGSNGWQPFEGELLVDTTAGSNLGNTCRIAQHVASTATTDAGPVYNTATNPATLTVGDTYQIVRGSELRVAFGNPTLDDALEGLANPDVVVWNIFDFVSLGSPDYVFAQSFRAKGSHPIAIFLIAAQKFWIASEPLAETNILRYKVGIVGTF